MKVYIVVNFCDSDREIDSVYLNKKDAENKVKDSAYSYIDEQEVIE